MQNVVFFIFKAYQKLPSKIHFLDENGFMLKVT